jgi:hypothetical protein
VLRQQLRGYSHRFGDNCRRVVGHHGCFHCRTGFTFRGRAEKGEKPAEELKRLIPGVIAAYCGNSHPRFTAVRGAAEAISVANRRKLLYCRGIIQKKSKILGFYPTRTGPHVEKHVNSE